MTQRTTRTAPYTGAEYLERLHDGREVWIDGYDRFPFVVGIWLLVGLAIVVMLPGPARRIGAGLAREEGLADEDTAPATGA